MRKIHIFVRFLDAFQKRRFLRVIKSGVGRIKFWRGVLRARRVHGPPQESAPTLFWAPGVPLGAAKVRSVTKFEVNPALELKVFFSFFEVLGAS